MKCPYCHSNKSKVLETRHHKNDSRLRRRRNCLQCDMKFNTLETVLFEDIMVIKKDGRREPFQREKLLSSLQKACQKRAIPHEALEKAVDTILETLKGQEKSEFHSDEVGKMVMIYLKKIDEVAYVRFASVYMSFKAINEFIDTIGKDTPWV